MTTATPTMMIVETTDGDRYSKVDACASKDHREVARFLAHNCMTMGFTIQYYRTEKNEIVKITKDGRLGLREIKRYVEQGAVEWYFSWAFATERFLLPSGVVAHVTHVIDLTKVETLRKWAKAF